MRSSCGGGGRVAAARLAAVGLAVAAARLQPRGLALSNTTPPANARPKTDDEQPRISVQLILSILRAAVAALLGARSRASGNVLQRGHVWDARIVVDPKRYSTAN